MIAARLRALLYFPQNPTQPRNRCLVAAGRDSSPMAGWETWILVSKWDSAQETRLPWHRQGFAGLIHQDTVPLWHWTEPSYLSSLDFKPLKRQGSQRADKDPNARSSKDSLLGKARAVLWGDLGAGTQESATSDQPCLASSRELSTKLLMK